MRLNSSAIKTYKANSNINQLLNWQAMPIACQNTNRW